MNRFYPLFLIIALLTTSAALGQDARVSGNVISAEDNTPVAGAIVQVQGGDAGTITDLEGRFTIRAATGDVLTISFLGMEPKTITVGDGQTTNIALEASVQQIDNVVVTALGIRRAEKALGYSVQSVDAAAVQGVPGLDVAASLTGKVAGMLVKNSSDFGSAPEITLRGETPLIVIDGVPYANMTMRDISAEDVESMSVLKGATASALYGYRGASGAVMVTTRNGSSDGEGVTVSLSTNTMFTAGYLTIPEVQSTYGRGQNNVYFPDPSSTGNTNEVWGSPMDGTIRQQWDPIAKEYREYPYLPVGKDNFRNFLEQGHITNNTVSVSYNTRNASIRNSLNWTQNKGQYPNSTYNKYSYTLAADAKFNKFQITSNAAYHKQQSPNIGMNGYTSYDPMYTLLIWTSADYDIRDYKDNYWLDPGVKQNFTYPSGHNNPYYDRYEKTKSINRDIFNASVAASYDFLPWLKATLRSGIDFYVDREDLKVAKGSYQGTGNTGIAGNTQATWFGQTTGGYATSRGSGYSLVNDLILAGDKTFGDFTIDGLLGGTIAYNQKDMIWGYTDGGISVPQYYSLNASVNPAKTSSTVHRQQVNSLYGRLALSWRSLVFVEGTLRNDWSSTLPKETLSYLYPSVAGSFVPSQLFREAAPWLDMWKVRASYSVSKTPAAIYATNMNYSVKASAWGSNASALLPSELPAATVFPEASSTFEIGTQAFAFRNRLSVDVTYYEKLMYDFLIKGKISLGSGFAGNYLNSKEQIVRRGWEIALTGTPVKTRDWQWDITANWSKYARYYKELDPLYSSTRPWVKKGERVDAYVLRNYALDSEGRHIVNNNGVTAFNPFDTRYGYSDPDWIWGLGTSLRWRSLTLAMSFDGRVGGLANTMTESYMWAAGVHPESVTTERAADVADPSTKHFLVANAVKVVSGSVSYDANGNLLSDTREFAPNDIYAYYKDHVKALHAGVAWGGNGTPADCYSTTFIKLRELSLTWNLPANFVKGWSKAASVSFVGQNLWFWGKDFKYSDPDGGREDFNDPTVRYLGFNLKLTF